MMTHFESLEAFRKAVAELGLPLTEEELQTAWPMVNELLDQAYGLRRLLEVIPSADLLSEAIRHARGG